MLPAKTGQGRGQEPVPANQDYRQQRALLMMQAASHLALMTGVHYGRTGLRRGMDYKSNMDTLMPDSKWATPWEVLSQFSYKSGKDMDKILVGRYQQYGIGLDSDQTHLLCCNARAGKSVSAILPLLLTYEGNMLVCDFKGELSAITARRRQEMGHKVVVIDASGLTHPRVQHLRQSYNILSGIDVYGPNGLKDVGLVAESLIVRTGEGSEKHWVDSASALLRNLILHILTYPAYEGRRDLVTLRRLLTRGVRREYNGETLTGMAGVIDEMLENEALDGRIADNAEAFSNKHDREAQGIISTAITHTEFLEYDTIRDVVRDPGDGQGFEFSDLKTSKGLTVYLSMSIEDMKTCKGWLRCMISLALARLERERSKPPIMPIALIDEFATGLGYMPDIETYAGFSIGVKLYIVVQTLTQLRTLYKDNWPVFLQGTMQSFGCSDHETLAYIEKRLGTTAWEATTSSRSYSNSTQQGSSDSYGPFWTIFKTGTGFSNGTNYTTSQSFNTSWQQGPLLSAEEISRAFARDDPQRKQLLIVPGQRPIWCQRNVYFLDPEFEGLWDPDDRGN